MSQQDQAVPLSERIRPGSEAAPWVCEAVQKLERENAELWKVLLDVRNDPQFHRIKNRTHLLVCTLLDRIEKAGAPHQPDSGEKA